MVVVPLTLTNLSRFWILPSRSCAGVVLRGVCVYAAAGGVMVVFVDGCHLHTTPCELGPDFISPFLLVEHHHSLSDCTATHRAASNSVRALFTQRVMPTR